MSGFVRVTGSSVETLGGEKIAQCNPDGKQGKAWAKRIAAALNREEIG